MIKFKQYSVLLVLWMFLVQLSFHRSSSSSGPVVAEPLTIVDQNEVLPNENNNQLRRPSQELLQLQQQLQQEYSENHNHLILESKLQAEIADLKKQLENLKQECASKTTTTTTTTFKKVIELKDKRPLSEFTIQQPNHSLALFDGQLTPEEKQFKFYGQFGEDRVILPTFFRNFKNGFFVELGAIDGDGISNTRVFQERLGWKGVLIEPSDQFEKLRVNPRCSLTGGAICLNLAICDSWRTAEFRTGGHPSVGGLQETMSEEHERVFFNKERKIIENVLCGPMGDALKVAGVKRVDFFSIDVEGAELYIVETMDWIHIPVHVVMIERREHTEETERMDRIMIQSGFQYYGKVGGTGVNSVIWVNPNNARPFHVTDSFNY